MHEFYIHKPNQGENWKKRKGGERHAKDDVSFSVILWFNQTPIKASSLGSLRHLDKLYIFAFPFLNKKMHVIMFMQSI